MWLAFDDVGEEDVGVIWLEEVDRDLLDGEDDRTGGEILLDAGPRLRELFFSENTYLRWLYPHFDAVIFLQLVYVLRDDGHAALPDILILTADADT